MKIFLTGGTGFIGTHIVPKLLEKGYDIILLVLKDEKVKFIDNSIKYIEGDLKDIDLIKKTLKDFLPDYLIHLAWFGLPDYSEKTCLYNFDISFNLFKIASEIVKKGIISTGSCWEYESRNGELTEESPLGGIKTFPAVKNSLRFLGESIANERKIYFNWMRLFFVYGPGQRKDSLIPTIINSIINGDSPTVKTPLNSNDFIYVEDVAEAICSVIDKSSGNNVFNVATCKSTSVSDIVKYVYKITGKDFNETLFYNQTLPVQNFWGRYDKIFNKTGWQPKTDIENGIIKTYENIIKGA